MIRKIIEKIFWYYQEKDNWKMKMNEPIAIKKLTDEETQKILQERKLKTILRLISRMQHFQKYLTRSSTFAKRPTIHRPLPFLKIFE